MSNPLRKEHCIARRNHHFPNDKPKAANTQAGQSAEPSAADEPVSLNEVRDPEPRSDTGFVSVQPNEKAVMTQTVETMETEVREVPDTPVAGVRLLSDVARATRQLEARSAVKSHVLGVSAVGLVPVPLADLVAVMGVQIKMVHALCKIYEVPFRQKFVRSAVASLVAGLGTSIVFSGLSSIAKSVPALGTLAGGAGVSATSAAVTYGIGEVFISHFEEGGTLNDFDPAKVKELLKAKIKEGKDALKSFKAPATAPVPAPTTV